MDAGLRAMMREAVDAARGASQETMLAIFEFTHMKHGAQEAGGAMASIVTYVHELEDRVKDLETEIGRMECSQTSLEFPEDCAKLQQVLVPKAVLTLKQCQEFWRWRSEEWSAGWMMLDIASDDEILSWYDEWKERGAQ